MSRHMKTKKEIQHRMMEMLRTGELKDYGPVEQARVHELEWVLDMRNHEQKGY